MPFLPLILLLAWQAISRSASFALGWATALYFGQVPGRQGRILGVVSLIAAAWVIVLVGFGLPLAAGAGAETIGLVQRNFDIEPLQVAGLAAAIILAPPAVAGMTVWAEFDAERSLAAWLRLIPVSYPATGSLGIAVLMMVAITPILLLKRWREKREMLQMPLHMREGTKDDDLEAAIRHSLATLGTEEVASEEATGPRAWPLLAVGYAAEHLLGAVVRGRPVRMRADSIEIYAYATNIALIGTRDDVYRVRAALEREVPFHGAHLTWTDEAQDFEDELIELHRQADGSAAGEVRAALDRIEARFDEAKLNSEEWQVLFRLRLQIERAASEGRDPVGRNGGGGRSRAASRNGGRRRSSAARSRPA